MKLILLSDIHFLDKNPPCRKDDLTAVQFEKMEYVLGCATAWNAKILSAGDLTDMSRDWDLLPLLIRLFNKYRIDMFACFGQHDMKFYNVKKKHATNLGVLISTGLVRELTDEPFKKEKVHIYGASFGQPVPKIKDKKAFNILVTHRGIGIKSLWPGHEYEDAKKFLKKHKFNLILVGDIHRKFKREYKGRYIVNTGCMLRHRAEEYNFKHRPGFYVIDTKTPSRIQWVKLPQAKAKDVLSREHIEKANEANEMMEEFVESVDDSVDYEIDFVSNLNSFMKKNKTKKAVKDIITNEIAEHERT